MFPGYAGQSVSAHALHETLQFFVSPCYALKEGQPQAALSAWSYGSDLRRCHPLATLHAVHTCAQIDHAAGSVQEPRSGIPLLNGCGMAPISPRKTLNRGNGHGTADSRC